MTVNYLILKNQMNKVKLTIQIVNMRMISCLFRVNNVKRINILRIHNQKILIVTIAIQLNKKVLKKLKNNILNKIL